MNVLYITHRDDKYGAAKSMQTIYKNITQYGIYPVVISCRKNRYNELADELGIRNYTIPYVSCTATIGENIFKVAARRIKYFIINGIAKRRILNIVDKEKIDIIHINTSLIDVGIYARKRRQIGLIWHIREYLDLDYNQFFLRKNQIERMQNYGDRYIYISNAIRSYWADKGLCEKGVVIYNGIDINKFNLNHDKRAEEKINIAFVGNISPNKGQYQLVDAIEVMPKEYRNKIHIYFFGTGREEYEIQLKKKISDGKLEDLFTFAGFVENINNEFQNV